MFDKILIANRGEIACRVMRTAHRLGIKTVAVYSTADKEALHVQLADEAIAIGPAPAAESYLLIDRIIQACRESGAQAVHPGYGFLSENAVFANALNTAGIAFIGPPSGAIESMGDKITSKKLAQNAGVNTIPGHTEAIDDIEQAVVIAADIGFPVMIKASAGGGGKGMRVAWNEQECRDGFERARSEARSSFGDDRVFIEKFIDQPRHIEIQIMADSHGNVIYLGERECSIQRRHQKVLEEAPSPFLDEATRRAMGEQAVALAKAVDYCSAGTVEFVVDQARNFYFLEMNTRLQVEHPVTEFITGLDLVELMIGVAAGQSLPLKQEDVRLNGWALEARVYAEDPLRNFMPSIGRLSHYKPPAEDAHVRVDTGVFEGAEVSMYYDPMIAKLVSWQANRDAAIETMQAALNRFHIQGVSHNIAFLSALVGHPRFVSGQLTTSFIAEEYPDGFQLSAPAQEQLQRFVAVLAAIHHCYAARAAMTDGQLAGHEYHPGGDWTVIAGENYFQTSVKQEAGVYEIRHGDDGGKIMRVELGDWRFGNPQIDAIISGDAQSFQLSRNNISYRLFSNGCQLEALVLATSSARLQHLMPVKTPPDMSKYLLSPMPGLLRHVMVEPGAAFSAGQDLVIVEAMKMENILRAEQDGVVATLLAEVGDSLSVDQPIIEFE